MRQNVKILLINFIFVCLVFSCISTGREEVQLGSTTTAGSLSLHEAIELSATEITQQLPSGTRVAIVAFSSEHNNISNYIMDELTGALVERRIEVADRRNLAFVYRELNFQMSGDVSDETAISIGRFLGAQNVITGQLINTGDYYRYRLSSINVETALQESSTRINIRNDRSFQNFITVVKQTPSITTSASYLERQNVSPITAGAFLDRGIYSLSLGEFDSAILEFTEAIRLNHNFAAAYDGRGFAHYNKGDYDQAIEDYNQAVRYAPNNNVFTNNLAKTYDTRGFMYFNRGDYDRAIADYTQAISLAPNNSVFINNLAITYDARGFMYFNRGDYDRAIADYTQAVRLAPNNTTYRNNLEIAQRARIR